MQDLIILNENQVIIQADNKLYLDTLDNFLSDYGNIEYNNIDYNRDTKGCILNGQWFCDFPNAVCENILNSIDELLDKKEKRETIPKSAEEIEAEETEKEINELETHINELKDDLLMAMLLNDAETIEVIKTEYMELLENE